MAEDAFGDRRLAARLRSEADRLSSQIEERFWWEEEGTYYLGLDGDKGPIDPVSSNPAHLLWQRAIDPERTAKVVRRLMAKDMWSGWGIRTLSAIMSPMTRSRTDAARYGRTTTPSPQPAFEPTGSTAKRSK